VSGARTLILNAIVHCRSDPFATALLIDDGVIAWVGDDAGARVHYDLADVIVDLDGRFVAPGFVDSHIHATSTGLQITGVDLTAARSAADVLALVEEKAKATRGGFIYGHGWDQTQWSDPQLPTRSEIDRASWGSEVYLSRIDVHSALVSSALVARVGDARSLEGFDAAGPVTKAAHNALREAALVRVRPSDRRAAHLATLADAAAHGIVSVHEMSGPSIGGADDLRELLATALDFGGPSVFGYWGQAAAEGGIEMARELGAIGVGGDLFVDGSLGSHTASLVEPYADDASTRGAQYLSLEEITDHLRAATLAGIPGGFHAIGDAACADVAAGVAAIADELGQGVVRSMGHRIEHAEMLRESDIAVLVNHGVTFSMQPIFDAYWGVPGGMYDQRLGTERAHEMNRLASIVSAGGRLAINSDTPVTPMRPWSIVRAATEHWQESERVSARAAFNAATRGGWRAIGSEGVGVIEVGAPAHLAVWEVAELEVRVPDTTVANWSTDARAATPGLPRLDDGDPACVATLVDGRVIHGEDYWAERTGAGGSSR
jgi:predicted amidohydrolase YtcJ